MSAKELPTKRRIIELALTFPSINDDDLRQIFYKFRALPVLKKIPVPSWIKECKMSFYLDRGKYIHHMQWLNDFAAEKGFPEPIFRDPDNYETSVDDYDYWYELKTEKQLADEEAARRTAVSGAEE